MIAANAGRYPASAQCEILGVPRSTCYAMRGRTEPAEAPDPAAVNLDLPRSVDKSISVSA